MLFSRFSWKSLILAHVNVLLGGGGAVIVHKARLLSRVGGGEGASTHLWPTYNQTHAGSSFSYLRFAEAASFDKKELCRSDTAVKIIARILSAC